MKNFLNRYSFCDSSSSFFKKETYQFHIIRQTVHILFRRHLRSINIPKFPNINACLVRNPLDKDTDLQGVVTCREHEKKSLVFDTLSLSLSIIMLLQKPLLVLSSIFLYNTENNSPRRLGRGGEGSEYSRRDRKKTENRMVSHSGEEEARGLASMPRQFRHEMRSSRVGGGVTPTSVEIVFHLERRNDARPR